MAIFSGNANKQLAADIAAALKVPLGKADVTQFSDGEIRVEINQHVRGTHTFIIQPTCTPTNDNIMQVLIMADALRRSAAASITAVIPYYGYSRQDRRPDLTRTPITSRLVADMLQVAGVNQVIVVDLHSGQQQGFFTIPVVNISASPIIVGDIWRHQRNSDTPTVIVSPDTGGVVRARAVAKQLNLDLVIIDKRRPDANKSEVMNIIGDVNGKRCILIDDLIDTAGTLCKGGLALKERGAEFVAAYATHPVLSGNAYENLSKSVIDEIVVTDTIPLTPPKDVDKTLLERRIRVISVVSLISESISRMRENKSISEIYA